MWAKGEGRHSRQKTHVQGQCRGVWVRDRKASQSYITKDPARELSKLPLGNDQPEHLEAQEQLLVFLSLLSGVN